MFEEDSNYIEDMFDYIVQSPFYSPSEGGEVLIDDMSRVWVDDEYRYTISWGYQIETFYKEWKAHTDMLDMGYGV